MKLQNKGYGCLRAQFIGKPAKLQENIVVQPFKPMERLEIETQFKGLFFLSWPFIDQVMQGFIAWLTTYTSFNAL